MSDKTFTPEQISYLNKFLSQNEEFMVASLKAGSLTPEEADGPTLNALEFRWCLERNVMDNMKFFTLIHAALGTIKRDSYYSYDEEIHQEIVSRTCERIVEESRKWQQVPCCQNCLDNGAWEQAYGDQGGTR